MAPFFVADCESINEDSQQHQPAFDVPSSPVVDSSEEDSQQSGEALKVTKDISAADATKLGRRKKLQHFLAQIKELARQQSEQQHGENGTGEQHQQKQRRRRKWSTLEALDTAVEVLRHSSPSVPVALPPAANGNNESDAVGFSPVASPSSPSSTNSSSADQQSGPKFEPNFGQNGQQQSHHQQHLKGQPEQLDGQSPSPPIAAAELLAKPCSSPQSGHSSSSEATAAVVVADFRPLPGRPPMLGRRFLGSLFVSLPEGAVLECRDSSAVVSAATGSTEVGGGIGGNSRRELSAVIRPGDSLLAMLHGKGAQTLLLNAFCGHARRRMYARLKWGNDGTVRACELLCEFSVDPQSVARRLASIQLFCVQSGGPTAAASLLAADGTTEANAAEELTFTTRHNSGCALIYLDSAWVFLEENFELFLFQKLFIFFRFAHSSFSSSSSSSSSSLP